jgi:hypothetical protein
MSLPLRAAKHLQNFTHAQAVNSSPAINSSPHSGLKDYMSEGRLLPAPFASLAGALIQQSKTLHSATTAAPAAVLTGLLVQRGCEVRRYEVLTVRLRRCCKVQRVGRGSAAPLPLPVFEDVPVLVLRYEPRGRHKPRVPALLLLLLLDCYCSATTAARLLLLDCSTLLLLYCYCHRCCTAAAAPLLVRLLFPVQLLHCCGCLTDELIQNFG